MQFKMLTTYQELISIILRDYDNEKELIRVIYSTENIVNYVQKLYLREFEEASIEYNNKQSCEDSNWQNFGKIAKAKISCLNSDISELKHFIDVSKLSKRTNNADGEMKDYKLTRYDCYLIAQNGESRKKVIALAQTYFAVQTRKHEISEKEYSIKVLLNYCES